MLAINMLCVLLVVSVSAGATTIPSGVDREGFPNTLGPQDFFTLKTSRKVRESQAQNFKDGDSCRENIQKVVCLVEPTKKGERSTDRECLPGSQNYAHFFEELHDHFPPAFQKMFCSLNHIYVEKEFFGTAYAGSVYDPEGHPAGAIMGIRQSVLDRGLTLTHWASWKEQLSFGGATDDYSVSPLLPQIQASTNGEVSGFLYFVVAHEFGHLFDFGNGLNKVSNCPEEPFEDPVDPSKCVLEDGTWGAISWLTKQIPRPQNDFKTRSGLCFYQCEGNPLSPNLVPEVYEALNQTDFISAYAATEPWDDFADSVGYFLINEQLRASYQIDIKQGAKYDIIQRLNGPKFAKKKAYIESFLHKTHLKYP